jgi:hypothetical protein
VNIGKKSSVVIKEPPRPSTGGASFAERINSLLKLSKGVFDAKRPGVEYPEFPEDITTLSDEDLGRLQGAFTFWANYIDEILSTEVSDMTYYEDRRDFQLTVARLSATDKTLNRRRDAAMIDDATQIENQKYLEMKARVEILKAKLRSCERAWRSLSRELSRRQIQKSLDE